MTPTQKHILILLLMMAAAAFIVAALPNAVASKNLAMVLMFEPDEGAPLPSLLQMIAPAGSVEQALRNFLFYDYYYYGFPYFAISALVILPLQWLGRINDLPLVMLVLRQVVSVLPMLAALLLLVYMQDGFRTYRSPVLFGLLLLVPAVVQNNFWWHPDGLICLMAVLTIFLLQRDNLRFGHNFLLAATLCGIATATKLVGAYFFLAIGLTLLLGLVLKKASLKRLVGMALLFLLVMAVAYLVSNPFLVSGWARTAYFNTFTKQIALLSEGYGVVYEKGLTAAWPAMSQFYGSAPFLLIALGTAAWGAWCGPRCLLSGLILAWFVPVSVSVLWFSHFKYQYWLPVALPLFSCLALLLPEKWPLNRDLLKPARLVALALLLGVLVQAGLFAVQDMNSYTTRLQRADNNQRIQFYDQAAAALRPIPAGQALHVYFDYRLYMPDTPGWATGTSYELLDYAFIQSENFDVLLLLEQRIRDYLNPNVTGIDPEAFARSRQFYQDAFDETIRGYRMVFRSPTGLVYVREDLYQKYFSK